MSTFLEIDRQIQETIEALESAQELGHGSMQDQFMNDLVILMQNQATKVDSCIGFIRHCESMVLSIDEETQRLKRLKDRYEKKIDWLKSIAKSVMDNQKSRELNGTLGRKFSLRDSKSLQILDQEIIPEKYMVTKTESNPDKRLIMEDLKEGLYVPGVQVLVQSTVQVR